jgi:carboxylate-amine ligase
MSPVPRLLTAHEAARLAAGLEQRVRALNTFVVDAYGERRIVAAGVIAEWVIDTCDGLEAGLIGRWPGGEAPIGVAGLDLVRCPDGELRVLEDNVRTPSGWSYAVAGVRAVRAAAAARDLALPAHADGAGALLDGLTRALRAAAPARTDDSRGADPMVVVLTEGPHASAYYAHRLAARHLGAPLLTAADLVADATALGYRNADGGVQRIDVVYRRCDEDRLYDGDGAPTPIGAVLLEPWLAGEIAIVNGFGTGIADDKLVHAHVEEMVRFYLGEEPLLPSVPTLDLTRDADLSRLLESPEEHVVKPRLGQGGTGVVVCGHASREDVARCLAEVREHPEDYVAQPTVTLSTHPAVVDGALVARHVDLRPFVFSAPGWTQAVPAGLTRVAWEEGSLVVNSSQDGGGKDTWVLD